MKSLNSSSNLSNLEESKDYMNNNSGSENDSIKSFESEE